jgi:hypothetical protein
MGELRASPIAFDASSAGDPFGFARKALLSPRPSAANIGRKFERCFKGRNESNLNVGGQHCPLHSVEQAKVPAKPRFSIARQQSGNPGDWACDNHAARQTMWPQAGCEKAVAGAPIVHLLSQFVRKRQPALPVAPHSRQNPKANP